MNDDVEELSILLRKVEPDVLVALACAAADRVLPVYDELGSGDPAALRETVESLWEWATGGVEPARAISHATTLEEFAAAHYEEADDVPGHVVAAALAPFEVFTNRSHAAKRATAAAGALVLNADFSDEVDGALEDAGQEGRAGDEEEGWRERAIELARTWTGPATRSMFDAAGPPPSWLPAFLRASAG